MLVVRYWPLSILTRECLEAILANAREHGCEVVSYRGRAFWYGFSPTVYRFQRMSRPARARSA